MTHNTPSRPRIRDETDALIRECQHLARQKARSSERRTKWETDQGKTSKDVVIREGLKLLRRELREQPETI